MKRESGFVVELEDVSKHYVSYKRPLDRLLAHIGERCLGGRFAGRKKRYEALEGVTLALRAGESLGVLGMNGAGKSTLLQIVAKTLQPSSGRVETKGRIAALLELGSGFNPDFTGRENVFLNARILGLSRQEIESKMEAILRFAEIGDFVNQPLKTYSSGMVVRLAFSVLTQIDPTVFIIDEALSVGDAYFSHKSANYIRDFRDKGGTLLFCSHNTEAIRTLCDRAVLLEKGVVAEEGDAERVVDYYNALISKKRSDFDVGQHRNEEGRYVTESGTREIVLKRLAISNETGEEAKVFYRDQLAIFRVECLVNRPVDDATIGIRIADRLGTTVFGVNTFHLNESLKSCKPGDRIVVDFSIRLNLGSGEYSLTMAAHSEDSHLKDNYYWIDNLASFTVVKKKDDHSTIGCCHLDTHIRLEKHSNDSESK